VKPVASKNRVLHSFSLRGQEICVDIFARPDGTFGFEEYRRDLEDQGGWFAIGFFSSQVFPTEQEALRKARTGVPWLDRQLGQS